MQDTLIVPKKDIIILDGSLETNENHYVALKIECVAQLLLQYFVEYECFTKTFLDRHNLSTDEIIQEYADSDKKLIITAVSHSHPSSIFKVVFVSSLETTQTISYPYDHLVNLRAQIDDDEIVQDLIVRWGCWLDDRKVTKPL